MKFNLGDKFVYLDEVYTVISFEECYKHLSQEHLERFYNFEIFLKACQTIDAIPSSCENRLYYWAHPKNSCIPLEIYNSKLFKELKEFN